MLVCLRRRFAFSSTLALAVFGCSSSTPSTPTTPPEPIATPDAGPAPVRDAGAKRDAAVDAGRPGQAPLVDEALLGCPGEAHLDGAPIDVTGVFASAYGSPLLASLTDGTYATLASGRGTDIDALRLDAKLGEVWRTPVGAVLFPKAGGGYSPKSFLAGSRGLLGIDAGEGEGFGTGRHFVSFFAADFATADVTSVGLVEGPSFRGGDIARANLTGEGRDANAWIKTTGPGAKSTVFRHSLTDPTKDLATDVEWQPTALEEAPLSQWTEGGKLTVEIGENAVVLAADGSVESSTPLPELARSTDVCEFPRRQRTPYGFVTVRQITAKVPCGQATPPLPPSEWWLHFPATGPGRKVAEHAYTQSGGWVDIEFPVRAANVMVREETGAGYTLRVQRFDARLENVGRELVVVSQDGVAGSAQRHLVAVANGYWLFVYDALTVPGKSRVRAFRAVCG